MSIDLDRLTALAERIRPFAIRTAQSDGWYRIVNATGDRAAVYLYGPIGDFEITADAFVRELRTITASAIDLHVNSPGGLVFDGVAIYSALRNHPATVDVVVDGIAASAASFVAMAGDSVAIERPARMMIHDAQGLTIGGPAEHREMLDLLDELSDTIALIYTDRAGGTVAGWRDAMRATTWYGAAAAVAAGLADRVVGEDKGAPENLRSQLIRARARLTLGRVA